MDKLGIRPSVNTDITHLVFSIICEMLRLWKAVYRQMQRQLFSVAAAAHSLPCDIITDWRNQSCHDMNYSSTFTLPRLFTSRVIYLKCNLRQNWHSSFFKSIFENIEAERNNTGRGKKKRKINADRANTPIPEWIQLRLNKELLTSADR